MNTIFWSWQSDLPPHTTRAFIESALHAAIARAADGLSLSPSERPEVDEGVKGRPGLAEIARTLFEKIGAAQLFVADITPLTRTAAGKALPNPNVTIELGYAAKALDWAHLILVMNTAGGWGVEDLPFDLKHRSGTIKYNLSADAQDDVRAAVFEDLVSELTQAISLAFRSRMAAPLTEAREESAAEKEEWEQWKTSQVIAMRHPYDVSSPGVTAVIPTKPRIYTRVVPKNPGQIKRVAALDALKTCNLAGLENGGPNGRSGITEAGIVAYGHGGYTDQAIVSAAIEWCVGTGELRHFVLAHNDVVTREIVVRMWADLLSRSRQFFQIAGASGPYLIDLGLTKANEVIMLVNGRGGPRALVAEAAYRGSLTSLHRDALESLIRHAEADLSDAFGLRSASDELNRSIDTYLRD